jgi:uroporphyrinogen decarboxylase
MTTATQSKADRVRLALAGAPVDRSPISFWAHNFARENSADALGAETVKQFQRHDWDFIKIQSRASCFAEGWGNRYRVSTERAMPPVLLDWPVRSAADLETIRPLDPMTGALGEQLSALRMIRQDVGPHVPILSTLFAPAMVLTFLVGESPERMLELVRSHPAAATAALGAIRDTSAAYAQACLEGGADGIFFAIKAACSEQMTREEYARFGLPFDRPVLDAARRGWLNMLHLCGPHLYFEVVDDLPSPLLNWALDAGNPRMAEGRDRARRAVIGGVSAKPRIREMSPAEVAEQVRATLAETNGDRVMIGPGCSIAPDTPETNLQAARDAAARWKPARTG